MLVMNQFLKKKYCLWIYYRPVTCSAFKKCKKWYRKRRTNLDWPVFAVELSEQLWGLMCNVSHTVTCEKTLLFWTVFTSMCLSSAASPGQVSDPQHFSSREPGVLPEDEGRLLPLPGWGRHRRRENRWASPKLHLYEIYSKCTFFFF